MTVIGLFGATSAIAAHTARALAGPETAFFLVARDPEKLARLSADLTARGAAAVTTIPYDFADRDGFAGLIETATASCGGLDAALIAFGTLTRQDAAERDIAYTAEELTLNLVNPACLAQLLANHMAPRGGGVLAVITSVAGDRGRGSNYAYGAAKGGLGLFLQGLRHRLAGRNVAVLDIRPGFVDTPMTRDFAKGRLWAEPQTVGAAIARAMRARRGGRLYVPGFWRWIMLLIRLLPTPLMHRTRL